MGQSGVISPELGNETSEKQNITWW